MSIGIEIFDNDERVLMNHLTVGVDTATLERKSVIASLDVAKVMGGEEDVTNLVESTRSKVNLLTDDEWADMRVLFPLDCVEPTDESMEQDGFAVSKNGILV